MGGFLITSKILGEGKLIKVKMRKRGFLNGRWIWKLVRFFRTVIHSFGMCLNEVETDKTELFLENLPTAEEEQMGGCWQRAHACYQLQFGDGPLG